MANKREGDMVGGDKITVGDISDSKGVAIGRDARAEVHYHYEYIDRPKLGVPYLAPSPPPHHVLRKAELVELRELLMGGERQVVALRGMGGVGKTTLAIALCHDKNVLEAFPDGVLWATLGPDGDVASAQQAWAEALANDDLGKVVSLEARASRLRSLLHGKTCLLVIDDVWEAEHLDHLQVGSQTCAILVTTRERKIAMTVGDEYQLGVLRPKEATDLLNKWAGKRDVGTRDEAAELAERLGYLPLALRLAGAQSLDDVKWVDLLNHFRQVQGDLSALDMDDAKRRVESLKLTFDLSLERLDKASQKRFEMLGVFAAGREAPFETEAAAAVWQVIPDDQAKETLRRLVRAALLDREDNSYVLHLLLGDYAQGRLDEATREAAEARHNAYYLEVAQRSAENWQAAEDALPQVRTAWRRAAKDDADDLYAWATAAKDFFSIRGHWADNIAWLEAARAAARTEGQRKREGWCEHELGVVYNNLGRLAEALAQYQAGLAIHRETGERHLEVQALNGIGYIYLQRGELDTALAQFQTGLAISREVGDLVGEAISLHFIGLTYYRRGELDKALLQFRTSLTVHREVGNRRLEAITLHTIGSIYERDGELDRALAQYQAGLAIHREVGNRDGEAATLHNIGSIHERRGALDEAMAQYQVSLAMHREVGDHVREAYSLNGIGRIHHQCGELDEALRKFQASLAILHDAGDRAGQAESLWNMGRTYEKMGRLAEAEGSLAEALALYKMIGMPETTQVRKDLEQVRSQLGGREK